MRIGSLPIPQPQELQGLYDAARLGKTGALNPAEGLAGTQLSEPAGKASFNNLLERAVAEVDGKMQSAAAEQAKVLTGETNNLHQAMIAMQEASTAFSLMVEVRNKLVESYQEIMRMQV
jgi:flagellar hook-basal body complex protein FliE